MGGPLRFSYIPLSLSPRLIVKRPGRNTEASPDLSSLVPKHAEDLPPGGLALQGPRAALRLDSSPGPAVSGLLSMPQSAPGPHRPGGRPLDTRTSSFPALPAALTPIQVFSRRLSLRLSPYSDPADRSGSAWSGPPGGDSMGLPCSTPAVLTISFTNPHPTHSCLYGTFV